MRHFLLSVVLVAVWVVAGTLNYRALHCHYTTEWPWKTESSPNGNPNIAMLALAVVAGPIAIPAAMSVLGDKCSWLAGGSVAP